MRQIERKIDTQIERKIDRQRGLDQIQVRLDKIRQVDRQIDQIRLDQIRLGWIRKDKIRQIDRLDRLD